MATAAKTDPSVKVIAQNRRARFDYELMEKVEAGIVLLGTEVKSLREGKLNLVDSYCAIDRYGEAFLQVRQVRLNSRQPSLQKWNGIYGLVWMHFDFSLRGTLRPEALLSGYGP